MSGPPQILAPRLYRTDIDILNSLSIDWTREEFEELRGELEADWNRAHFKWEDDAFDLDYEPLWSEFYEFLNRSAIGEFSGACSTRTCTRTLGPDARRDLPMHVARRGAALIVSQFRHAADGTPLRSREPAEYPGHVVHASQMDFRHDVFVRLVGFYRYQNISDHLKRNPQYRFHPIFRYFDNWCKDERRHSRFFALMLHSQPDFMRGSRNRFAIKFFTLAVYITMYLRDSESAVYERLGIDWEKFDVKVINETERAAREVWGLGIRTDSPYFLSCLRRMARNNARNKRGRRRRVWRSAERRHALRAVCEQRVAIRQTDGSAARPVEVLPRSRWTEACPMPAERPSIELAGAPAIVSGNASGSRPTHGLPKP